MNEPTIETLAQQIGRLERENRRLKWIGASSLVGIVILAVMIGKLAVGKSSMPSTALLNRRIVEAEKFVLKDTDGRVRAILGAELEIANVEGSPTVLPETSLDSYGLHLYGADGRHRAALIERKWEGGAGGRLSLFDKNSVSSAYLAVASGYASLELEATERSHEQDEREQEIYAKRWNSAKSPEEKGKVDETTSQEGYTAKMTAWSHGQRSYLIVGGHTTKARDNGVVELNSSKGQPSVVLRDEKDKDRLVLGHTELKILRTGSVEKRPASSLVLFKNDGRVIWQVPAD